MIRGAYSKPDSCPAVNIFYRLRNAWGNSIPPVQARDPAGPLRDLVLMRVCSGAEPRGRRAPGSFRTSDTYQAYPGSRLGAFDKCNGLRPGGACVNEQEISVFLKK